MASNYSGDYSGVLYPKSWDSSENQKKRRKSKSPAAERIKRRNCEGKRRFRDQKEAKVALKLARKNAKRELEERGATSRHESRFYFCQRCSGYHLTSKPEYRTEEAA